MRRDVLSESERYRSLIAALGDLIDILGRFYLPPADMVSDTASPVKGRKTFTFDYIESLGDTGE